MSVHLLCGHFVGTIQKILMGWRLFLFRRRNLCPLRGFADSVPPPSISKNWLSPPPPHSLCYPSLHVLYDLIWDILVFFLIIGKLTKSGYILKRMAKPVCPLKSLHSQSCFLNCSYYNSLCSNNSPYYYSYFFTTTNRNPY